MLGVPLTGRSKRREEFRTLILSLLLCFTWPRTLSIRLQFEFVAQYTEVGASGIALIKLLLVSHRPTTAWSILIGFTKLDNHQLRILFATATFFSIRLLTTTEENQRRLRPFSFSRALCARPIVEVIYNQQHCTAEREKAVASSLHQLNEPVDPFYCYYKLRCLRVTRAWYHYFKRVHISVISGQEQSSSWDPSNLHYYSSWRTFSPSA